MSERISAATIRDLALQISRNERIRQDFEGIGRLFLDRHLPFLILYRKVDDGVLDTGTAQLATTEASWLVADSPDLKKPELRKLVGAIARQSIEKYGVFLLIEIWARTAAQEPIGQIRDGVLTSGFRLFSWPETANTDTILDTMHKKLIGQIGVLGDTTVQYAADPKKMKKRPDFLLGRKMPEVFQVGLEVEPCYRSATGQLYPAILKSVRQLVSGALRYSIYHFIRQETRQRPVNFNALGRRGVGKAVWETDRKLDAVSSKFEFLLSIAPINVNQMWRQFQKSNYEKLPSMRYRPLSLDVSLAKRELFSIAIEKVEDPSLAHIFLEKQEELDRQLTLLKDRGTAKFLQGSIQLYGNISNRLVRSAEELLERVATASNTGRRKKTIPNTQFLSMAGQEIEFYKSQWPDVTAQIRMSPGLLAGLMVSGGTLLVAPDIRFTPLRAQAIIQHEVGTHMVTWFNGKYQPLTQLRSGLADYEELQEGLAVFAEYMVGGLTRNRMRTLAARVIAARAIIDGATFVDTFRLLCRYGFEPHESFRIVVRIFRGGGYTKDCIYLRGFQKVLRYIQDGNDLHRLFIGKIALKHTAIIDELLSRKVLLPPPLTPRFLADPNNFERLERLRHGVNLYDLLQP